MNVVPFDTLELARAFRDEVGFDQRQAEGITKVLARVLIADLAAKSDIQCVRADIEAARAASKADIETLSTAIKTEFLRVRADIETSSTAAKTEFLCVRADIEALKAATEARVRETELRLEAKIESSKADLLKVILGSMTLNAALVLGAMFGLAKLLGH